MTTGAFSRNISKLFSELKLVTDNLPHYVLAIFSTILVLVITILKNPPAVTIVISRLLNKVGANIPLPYKACFVECKIQQRMGSTIGW